MRTCQYPGCTYDSLAGADVLCKMHQEDGLNGLVGYPAFDQDQVSISRAWDTQLTALIAITWITLIAIAIPLMVLMWKTAF